MLKSILKKKEKGTPVIFTIFNPLAMAAYLAGEALFLAHLRTEPGTVKLAIDALTGTCSSFVKEVISLGCDGIFLSTKFASYDLLNDAEYKKFGRPADIEVLKAASRGWFNVLHLHGQYPMFESLADYPVQAVNWHDRTAYPSLAQAGKLFKGALMAGVEQLEVLHLGTPEQVDAQVLDAVKQTGGRRLIVAPGCTYPVDVPHRNLMAMRMAVEKA
jgi:uroporphyrinogen decarboxylase